MKRREPFIGITCDLRVLKERKKSVYELICDDRYPRSIRAAGGYPIIVPVVRRRDIICRYLDRVDGLVIVGGDDVDPRLYGEKKKPGTGTVPGLRLHFERNLYHEARKRELPILGICYGMQLINVLEGGTLFQDIARDAKSGMNHRDAANPCHPVRINAASRLGKILGKRLTVSSDHHQAVCRVAPDFRPVAFSSDGIIEAVESDSEKILAVQWHPERDAGQHGAAELFRAFVRLCALPSSRR
ncbi:MAG: gamma-glutamyl-gamma-aminobutyrate hydrolase family protein [Candidatus Omnitrophota bacterium]|jgi:putative glutamine amidotransferase